MWGTAKMAGVTLLGCLMCLLARGEAGNTEMSSVDTVAEAILERATLWLWSRRDKDAGWGSDTQRVLLALRLGNLSKDDNIPPPVPLEMQLSIKKMELEILLLPWRKDFTWRHSEDGFSLVRLARYTLTLNALCMDPRQFYGNDLIGMVRNYDLPTDYEFALTTLAACSAQAHCRKRQIRRLLYIASAVQDNNLDTVAMVIIALRCIVQDHRRCNLHHFIRNSSLILARQQRADGSFGDLHTTSLVMQALEETDNEPRDTWNKTAALAWLSSRQRPDGSFEGDVRITAEVVLGIIPHGLATIRALDCGQGLNDIAPAHINLNVTDFSLSKNHTDIQNISFLGNMSYAGSELLATQTPILANVSYTIWVGNNVNETYNIWVTAPKNETFFSVMLLAAEMSPHFQFEFFDWPNSHYVHTLASYKEEPMTFHYWLLYQLPSPPEPSFPPESQFLVPEDVDDLEIREGDYYLFWYKELY